MLNIIIYIVLGIVAVAGIVLTILNFPGIWLIYFATLILAIMDGFEKITPLLLIVLFFVSVLSTLVDNVVIAMGAKRMGGSKWGILGAILGGIVGLIVGSLPGLFLGPLVGATLFELVFAHKDLNESFKAGFGSFLGVFFSIFLKTVVNVIIVVFVISRLL